MEFRKQIIRSSSSCDDIACEADYKRINETVEQVTELLSLYYGLNNYYLPFTHDREFNGNTPYYTFNPEAADIFLEELISTIDELYWNDYPLPEDFFEAFDSDTILFYKSYLYLIIRIASIKNPYSKEKTGTGTFMELYNMYSDFVIPYTEDIFHRKFEIGIRDNELPGIFEVVQNMCVALGAEDSFLHKAESDSEQENALEQDNNYKLETAKCNAAAKGMELEQFLAMQDYLNENKHHLLQQKNEEMKANLGDFPERDKFISYAATFRDLFFRYNNHRIEHYIDTAIKLFLLRNNMSVLSHDETYTDTQSKIYATMTDIRSFVKKMQKEQLYKEDLRI
ncbi:MAG: hypothetical protein K6G76_07825 [Lachnospiraceae bacterium]|nr:hypothetical protein [Lachnospiraceae bacterium]